jgi:hypothetical protein
VLPPLVALDPHSAGTHGVIFAAFLFVQLWFLNFSYAMLVAAAFYRYPAPRFFDKFLGKTLDFLQGPPRKTDGTDPGWFAVVMMFVSYVFTVYAFGVAYIFISNLDQFAFSTGHNLSFIDGLYFSVITAATVGYGDIFPTLQKSS